MSATLTGPLTLETVARCLFDLREERAAQGIGGNEVRANKGDDGADDGDGRKAEERNPHVPLPDLKIRVVNELHADP